MYVRGAAFRQSHPTILTLQLFFAALFCRDDFSALVAEKYMKMFDFSNVSLDDSLRYVANPD